ncbi:MAG: transcriptional repressor [Chitinophagales bacterium]|nr:transcriptional repressor [Chitinophagales bacterium]
MSKDLDKILKMHDLRITQVRKDVLAFFSVRKVALSHADIEEHFSKKADRVTIYRTLHSFLEKGVLHKVLDDTGVAKYALCADHCETHQHSDNHVHFKCMKCLNIECLHHVHIPKLNLPTGYALFSSNLLMEGVCKHCSME